MSAPAHLGRRRVIVGIALGALLVAAVLVSAIAGQFGVSLTEVVGSLLRSLGIPNGWAPDDPTTEAALWVIRFPRIVMACAVGAALAVAGAVMQAIFGNPLAEPGVVGVSSGAALGAAIAIVGGMLALGEWTIAVLAFAGGLLATLLVYGVSRANGRTEVVTLLLTGIAVNAFGGAGLAFLLFLAGSASREQIVFWQLGSLSGSLWREAAIVAVVAVAGTAVAVALGRRFDILALGERNARHLGIDVERLRFGSIVLVALLTGAAVAFVGIIAFVGLVVPHLMRMILGPSHRALLVASAVGGALLLVVADLLARTLVPGAELPIGLLTSLIGGPFFFVLLWRQRRASGGWA
ncbi:FecCD family ABC transporter permease [Protaetiibacter mangrovi]|uniref:Iron ABC transporter permease n=1 Tax=Protaetiibacter mangrovi TaxID=2970926 RepID=A0ABT1ZH97_9MICO|nr:iron ABC transporter permease [Protaetiibacter mangrovi]MCS0499960.1 iron ABC transporter permease [Protaetiibacter mangrovi]TPX05117.1 iron ABC transporter permease [Schumannella luteola]